MKPFDFGAFFRAAQKAYDDLKANKPLPPRPAATGADVIAGAKALEALLPRIVAYAEAQPGEILALDDMLEFLEAEGVSWAAPAESVVNAAPGAAATASQWLPTLIGVLSAIQPTAVPLPGEGPRVGRG